LIRYPWKEAVQDEPSDAPPLRGEENVGVRVRLEREARGWSTTMLSDLLNEAGYEINPSAVWRIENHKRRVNLDEAIGFADAFGISLENLVGPPKLASHTRALELVDAIRRAYREVHRANTAFGQARDALDAYLERHPDIRDEIDAVVSSALVDEITSLPEPHELLRATGTPAQRDEHRGKPGT
jgi:transcriptional regulator with XRE-family HTH domain